VSLNEHVNPSRSNLTADQKAAELRALYGHSEVVSMSKSKTPQFTAAEIQKMREIVAAQEPEKPKEFDLNNPPKEPYTHQEFPKMVYFHGESLRHLVVENEEQLQELLAGGWSESSVPASQPDKPKRGRPAKEEE
jgi:hypothetical protein